MVGKAAISFARLLGVPSREANRSWQRGHSRFIYDGSLRLSAALNYSSTSKVAEEAEICGLEKHFLVDYLKGSLNFSQDDAISAVSKVTTRKCQSSPALVVDYLKGIGMELTHIKAAVSKHPRLLLVDPDKIIHPKIQCLQELGLSGPDLANFIVRDASFLFRGLETHLRPIINFVRQVSGGNKNAVKALKRSGRLLSFGRLKLMEENVRVLRDSGIPEDKIQWFLVTRPNYLTKNSDRSCKMVSMVENEIGIPRSSSMFYSGLCVASQMSVSTVNKKFEILRSLGWSKSDISNLVQRQPSCLMLSEARLRKKLNFLMKKLGYGPHYLADRPMLLLSSLEKKTIPRSQVLKTLEEHQLKVCSLFTSLFFTESQFLVRYLIPYKDKLPNMYENYRTSIEQ
ncbi:unnamed protein product [Cuscuta europaea]|uniref:Uncharacterized protein n=1 Tax=Cuscuta europaea TaxID=41803 RepID=A0A9P0Z6P6_CUSEU|nr:unnamed protein product [Cuscuta europaea]